MQTSKLNIILPLDALVRSVALNSKTGYAFFLGAGASVSSGIPDAASCIWQWKRAIFLSNHLDYNKLDLALPQSRMLIQSWLDAQGCYPALDSPEEYSFYAEVCYPILEDRRQYFQLLAEQATPSVGYQLLCLLAQAAIVSSVWTTNFDGLTIRTAMSIGTPFVFLPQAEPSWDASDGLLYAALHGDYRFSALKNTTDELREMDRTLRQMLISHLQDHHLIVVGYSGRDQSVMAALAEAYTTIGEGRLYWCGYPESVPDERVENLIAVARSYGRSAHYVPSQGFDDLLTRLALRCLPDELRQQANEWPR